MEDKRIQIINHIKERLKDLKELNQTYSEEKINKLADNLLLTNKSLEEICTLIDNKFSNQLRKVTHNNYLASLREYYISSISKLKKGNNCYLLSYDEGVKVLEQALITPIKDINPNLKLVKVNNSTKGYTKENSINNDYELILSDIAYLLSIPYAKTYRIFKSDMQPIGVLNITFEEPKEKFLNLEDALRFIKEESPKFTLKEELVNIHDRKVRLGLKEIYTKEDCHKNLEYVLKLFSALPDIKEDNLKQLEKDYFQMKIFELLTNSLNNNLSNIGIIVNKEKSHYTYKLSPSYNKFTVSLPSLGKTKTICNFDIVEKNLLLETILTYYYIDVKELLSLIVTNKVTLLSIINQVIKEHLEYDEYNTYHEIIKDNLHMIKETYLEFKNRIPLSKEDEIKNQENNELYNSRITPFMDNYISDEYEGPDKGSIVINAIITLVLLITVGIIAFIIYSVSKMNM